MSHAHTAQAIILNLVSFAAARVRFHFRHMVPGSHNRLTHTFHWEGASLTKVDAGEVGRIAEGFEVLGPYGVYSKRAFIPGFAHGVLEEIGK